MIPDPEGLSWESKRSQLEFNLPTPNSLLSKFYRVLSTGPYMREKISLILLWDAS